MKVKGPQPGNVLFTVAENRVRPHQLPLRQAGSSPQSYTSFRELDGRLVSLDEIVAEVQRSSAELIFGVLARIAISMVTDLAWFDPRSSHGHYLNDALVDDFPTSSPSLSNRVRINRVAASGGRHFFIHEHNILALAQLTIRYADLERTADRVSRADYQRVCRILLILNDHLDPPKPLPGSDDLSTRQAFARQMIYFGLFNTGFDLQTAAVNIIRMRALMLLIPDATRRVFEAAAHVSTEQYFQAALYLLLANTHAEKEVSAERSPWAPFPEERPGMSVIESLAVRVAAQLCRPLADMRQEIESWDASRLTRDFSVLCRSPVAYLPKKGTIIPASTLLARWLSGFPFLTLLDKNCYDPVGRAYEKYTSALLKRIASRDKVGAWILLDEKVLDKEGIDGLLWRDGVAVILQHKAKVPTTSVDTRTARNALGPCFQEEKIEECLQRDKSPILSGALRLLETSAFLNEFLLERFGASSAAVYPVVTLLSDFYLGEPVRTGYLRKVPDLGSPTQRHGLAYARPEWFRVVELESLAQLADEGGLDLLNLLELKQHDDSAFDIFLNRHGALRADKRLTEAADEVVASFCNDRGTGTTQHLS